MADMDFSVNVDTTGAVKNIKTLEASVSGLTTVFAGLAGVISLNALIKFSDEITNLKNQLNQFATSQQNVNDQFQGLAAIAINSRASLSSVGDLYAKIVRSADQLGISQKDAAQITETVSKALAVSGQSAQSASGSLLQLGQALASGRLQGDELRSILEGMPAIARILADSLGVPVSALKQLGSSGQISAEQVVQALLKAKDVIDNQFAKTVPTIGQAFETLKTSAALAFNNFEQNTQTGQNFALSIEYLGLTVYKLGKNIDAIVEPLTMFIKVVGAIAAFTFVGRVVEGLVAVLGVLRTVIFGIPAAIGAVVERFAEFAITMEAAGGGLQTFGAVLSFILSPLKAVASGILQIVGAVGAFLGLDKAIEWFKSLGDSNSDARKELEDYRKELTKLQGNFNETRPPALPGFVDEKTRIELEKSALAYMRQNVELERKLGFERELIGVSDQQKTVKSALFDLESNYLAEVTRLTDEYKLKSISKNKDDQAQAAIIQQQIVKVSQAYEQQIGRVKDLVDVNYTLVELEKQRVNFAEYGIKVQIDGNKKLRDLQDDIAKSTMSELEKKYYDLGRAAEESARSQIEAENSRRRGLKLAEMTTEEERKYYDESKKGLEDLRRATESSYKNSRDFATGWKQAFNEYVDNATNAAQNAKNIFSKFTQGMEDLIVNFVKTGKFEWKSFVASMAEELLRSQIRQLFASIFTMGQTGGAFGGIGGMLGGLFGGGQAKGDSATNPVYVMDISGGGGGFGGGGFGGFGGGFGGGGFGQPQGGGIFNSVGNMFKSAVGGIGSVFGGITDTIGSIASGIGDFFGGMFADGGTLPAGKFGIVGERGPELIGGPANISPLGGSVVYNINAVDAASFKALVARDPGFIHAVAMQGARSIPGRY